MSLTEANRSLLQSACDIIARRGYDGCHEVGAALRTRTGHTFAAVHLEAYVGRVAVCAEAVAPCGMGRELVSDYSPSARVIVPGERGPEEVPISALLPRKYERGS